MSDALTLHERFAAFRTRTAVTEPSLPPLDAALPRDDGRRRRARAHQLAEILEGSVEVGPTGAIVRLEGPPLPLALDRALLATLPYPIDPVRPLVCLDTETTGLGTAAGTVVFLVGLGRWNGHRFSVTQLLLPDHADEPAFLAALAAELSADAWLVTYNGRAFDWPLLETRYRLRRQPAPPHAGHLDLLPIARQLFRHRLPDARLASVEAGVCGIERIDDLPGASIPGRYLDFLHRGDGRALADVVRHNHEDVRSLGRLLVHLNDSLADPDGRRLAHPGDLGGLARAFVRGHRLDDALDCVEAALPAAATRRERDRLAADRARLLRRLGRHDDALAAWETLASAGGPLAALAWVQVAKALEHRQRDAVGALAATEQAAALVARARLFGRDAGRLERDLSRRRIRLARRLARRRRRDAA